MAIVSDEQVIKVLRQYNPWSVSYTHLDVYKRQAYMYFFSRENSFVQYRNPTAALLVFTVAPSGMASRHFRLAWAQQPQWVTFCT